MIPHDIQDIPVSILNMTVARMCSVSQVYSGATVVMWRLPRGEGSRWSVGEDQIVVGETSDLWAKLQKLTRNTKKKQKSIKKTYVEDIYIYILPIRTTVIHEYHLVKYGIHEFHE